MRGISAETGGYGDGWIVIDKAEYICTTGNGSYGWSGEWVRPGNSWGMAMFESRADAESKRATLGGRGKIVRRIGVFNEVASQ